MNAPDLSVIHIGRMALATWLHAAETHGSIYYVEDSVSRSGMSRKIRLSTIIPSRTGRPELVKLWPSLPLKVGDRLALGPYHIALDAIAADWGFSFRARAFDVRGGGMDMVFELVDRLATLAGLAGTGGESYANRVRQEAF